MAISEKTIQTIETLQSENNQMINHYQRNLTEIAEELLFATETLMTPATASRMAVMLIDLKRQIDDLKG